MSTYLRWVGRVFLTIGICAAACPQHTALENCAVTICKTYKSTPFLFPSAFCHFNQYWIRRERIKHARITSDGDPIAGTSTRWSKIAKLQIYYFSSITYYVTRLLRVNATCVVWIMRWIHEIMLFNSHPIRLHSLISASIYNRFRMQQKQRTIFLSFYHENQYPHLFIVG